MPDRIFNVVETGISIIPNKTLANYSREKEKTSRRSFFSRARTIGDRRNMYERCSCSSSRVKELRTPVAIASPHESGWMQSDLFVKWFEHFMRYANPTKERPVLLILDGHKTHTNNPQSLLKWHAKTTLLFCAYLRTYYTQSAENWLRNHPGRVVTTFQTAGLFGSAYLRAATMLTAVNGFRKTGI